MGIFRTNDPTQFDDVDGIIIDESAPPASIQGVSTNVALLIGQFQRGPTELTEVGSIAEFHELFGKSSFLGNKQLKNKRFGRLKIVRAVASAATKASYTFGGGTGAVAETYAFTTIADVASSLNNKYITFETISSLGVKTKRYIWFNVAGAGVDPAIALRTAHAVAFAANATADQVAAAIQAVATAIPDLNATVLTNVVTFVNEQMGDVEDATIGNSGFSLGAITQGNEVDRITFTAKNKGAYGNSLKVTISDGSVQGKKYLVEDTNANAVIAPEVYDNILIASIVASTFVGSKLVDVAVVSSAAEPFNASQTALAGGTEGSIANTDYLTAITASEQEGAANVVFLDEYNATRNGYLKTSMANTQDRIAIIAGAESDSRATAVTDVANYRDTDGRLIYAFPWIQTTIDGVLEYTSPASWYASILTQIGPHIDPAFAGNAAFTQGISALKIPGLSRNDYIALKDAGVSAFEQDPDLGFKVKSGITTQILNSSKVTVLRRRMADYLTNSAAQFLKNYQNNVNSLEKRSEVKGQFLDFIQRQEQAGILPGDKEVKEGKAKIVDTEVLNSDSSIALGFFKILWKQRIFSAMRYIVLQAEIGESVVVTEQEA